MADPASHMTSSPTPGRVTRASEPVDAAGIRPREGVILRRRAVALAQPPHPSRDAGGDRRLLCFRLGPARFALDVDSTSSVLRLSPDYQVPCMPAAVPGFVPVRGQLVAAIDLAALLSLPAAVPAFAVVATSGGNTVALLAAEIEGDRFLGSDALYPVPVHLGAECRQFLAAVSADMTLVLNLQEVFQAVRNLTR